MDIVVVRAMADKRKLQGKAVGETVSNVAAALDPSLWHPAHTHSTSLFIASTSLVLHRFLYSVVGSHLLSPQVRSIDV